MRAIRMTSAKQEVVTRRVQNPSRKLPNDVAAAAISRTELRRNACTRGKRSAGNAAWYAGSCTPAQTAFISAVCADALGGMMLRNLVSLLPAALLLILHSGQALRDTQSRLRHNLVSLDRSRAEQRNFCKHQSVLISACGPECPEVLVSRNYTGVPDIRMVLYQDNDWMAKNVKEWQGWETMGMTQMQKVIRANPGGYVVDIGSNLGWYTLLAAAQGAPVLAIEPLAKNLLRLRGSLCRNPTFAGRVTLLPTALGESSFENCKIMSEDNNQGNGVLDCTDTSTVPPGFVVRQRGVHVSPLDTLLKDVENIVYIKMDVEGHEPFAVKGGHRTFFERRVPYIMLEYNSWALQAKMAPDPPQQFLQQFANAGYALSLTGFDGEEVSIEQIHKSSLRLEKEVYLTYKKQDVQA